MIIVHIIHKVVHRFDAIQGAPISFTDYSYGFQRRLYPQMCRLTLTISVKFKENVFHLDLPLKWSICVFFLK
jgi:hypothetical protein